MSHNFVFRVHDSRAMCEEDAGLAIGVSVDSPRRLIASGMAYAAVNEHLITRHGSGMGDGRYIFLGHEDAYGPMCDEFDASYSHNDYVAIYYDGGRE